MWNLIIVRMKMDKVAEDMESKCQMLITKHRDK